MGLALVFWLDFNDWVCQQAEHKLKDMRWRMVLLAAALSFTSSIAYSRVFLGVHSLNQVFFGMQVGAWFALTANFIVKEPLM